MSRMLLRFALRIPCNFSSSSLSDVSFASFSIRRDFVLRRSPRVWFPSVGACRVAKPAEGPAWACWDVPRTRPTTPKAALPRCKRACLPHVCARPVVVMDDDEPGGCEVHNRRTSSAPLPWIPPTYMDEGCITWVVGTHVVPTTRKKEWKSHPQPSFPRLVVGKNPRGARHRTSSYIPCGRKNTEEIPRGTYPFPKMRVHRLHVRGSNKRIHSDVRSTSAYIKGGLISTNRAPVIFATHGGL